MRTDDVDCVYVRELLETGAESEDEAHEAVRKSVVEAIANRVPAVNVMDTAELRHRDNSKSHEEVFYSSYKNERNSFKILS